MRSQKSEPAKHSKWSASDAKNWLACPGKIKMCEGLPEEEESLPARTGTAAHGLAEACLKLDQSALKLRIGLVELDRPGDVKLINDEMRKHVQKFVSRIDRDYKKKGFTVRAESRADLSFIHEGMYGTNDVVAIEEFGDIYVDDLKYGVGRVNPIDNPQTAFYGLALAHEVGWDFGSCHMTIDQPRVSDGLGTWTLTAKELRPWVDIFKRGVEETLKPNPKLNAGGDGSQCHYCRASAICPELNKRGKELVKMQFEAPVTLLGTAGELTKSLAVPNASTSPLFFEPEEIGMILDRADQVTAWLKSVEKFAKHLLENGVAVPGYKLVNSKSQRTWTNAEQVADEATFEFGPKAFKFELLSPAQLEKIAGKKWVAPRVSRYSSGVTLAPERDPRPRVPPRLNREFDEPIEIKPTKRKVKNVKRTKRN